MKEVYTATQDHSDIWPGAATGICDPAMARLWIDTCISCCHQGSCRGPHFELIPEAMLVFEGQIAVWAIQPGRHELWSRVMSGSMALLQPWLRLPLKIEWMPMVWVANVSPGAVGPCQSGWSAMPTRAMMISGPGLLPRTIFVSVVLPQTGYVLMSMAHVVTQGHMKIQNLRCHLWSCWCQRAMLPEWHLILPEIILSYSLSCGQGHVWVCGPTAVWVLLLLKTMWMPRVMLGQVGLQGPPYFWVHASMNDLSYQPGPWWHPDLACCHEPCLDPLKLGSVWIPVFCIACKDQADINILGHLLGPSYWLRAEHLLGHIDLSFLHYQLGTWCWPALGWVCGPVAVLVRSVAPVATENGEDGLHRFGPAPHWLQH